MSMDCIFLSYNVCRYHTPFYFLCLGSSHGPGNNGSLILALTLAPGGVGQDLFAESAMIMCTGFNCIPHMQKTALSSVLVTPA